MFTPLLEKLRLFVASLIAAVLFLLPGCKQPEQLPPEIKEQLAKSQKDLAQSDSNDADSNGSKPSSSPADSGNAKVQSDSANPSPNDATSKPANSTEQKTEGSSTKPAAALPNISDINEDVWIDVEQLPWSYAEAHYVGATRIGFATLRVETTQVAKQLKIVREDIIDHAADGSPIPPRRIMLELYERNSGELMTNFKFESSTDGEIDLLIEGRRTGSQLTVTKKVSDQQAETAKVPWNLKFWGPLGVQEILMREPMKAGEKRTSSVFVPQLLQFVPVRLEAKQLELTPLADGKTASLMQINLTVGANESASFSSLFVDERGVIQKTISRNGDQILLKLRIEEQVARRLADQTQFSRWSGKTLKLIGDSAALEASSNITYLVEAELDESDPFNALLAYKRQRLKSRSPTSCEVQVSKNSGSDDSSPPAMEADHEPTDAQKNASVMVPSDKEPIIELVTEILGEAASNQRPANEVAELLRAGLHQKIKLRNDTTDISSTLVAARERTGGSIEMANLLAASLRNQKIPCRIVSGLRFDPKIKAFGFHVWNQAWIDGKWLDLDATNPSIVTSAYIAMTVNSGEGENPFSHYLDTLSKINKLNSITILTAEN